MLLHIFSSSVKSKEASVLGVTPCDSWMRISPESGQYLVPQINLPRTYQDENIVGSSMRPLITA